MYKCRSFAQATFLLSHGAELRRVEIVPGEESNPIFYFDDDAVNVATQYRRLAAQLNGAVALAISGKDGAR